MHVDQLEPRRLFAATAALAADGVLRVFADNATKDISVLPSSEVNFAKLKGSPAAPEIDGDRVAVVADRRLVGLFDQADVNKLIVYGNQGSNRITAAGRYGTGTFRATPFDGIPANDTQVMRDIPVRIDGGAGNDTLTVIDAPKSMVLGGAGNDTLLGGSGKDELVGGRGDDVLNGGTNTDTLAGGAGRDTASYEGRTEDLFLARNNYTAYDGHVTAQVLGRPISYGSAIDVRSGAVGEDDLIAVDVEALLGGSGNDRLEGTTGVDVLQGGAGRDTLIGYEGRDELYGNDGDDLLDARAERARIVYFATGPVDPSFDDHRADEDKIVGGPGEDYVIGDQLDLARTVETFRRDKTEIDGYTSTPKLSQF